LSARLLAIAVPNDVLCNSNGCGVEPPIETQNLYADYKFSGASPGGALFPSSMTIWRWMSGRPRYSRRGLHASSASAA